MTVGAELDAGSFRDPDSRVFYADGAVLRALSERGARNWRALAVSRLFGAATAEGRLVATEEVAVGDDLQLLRTERPAAVLRHERIPFVSYPYEWTPGMLRDAALLQLDLLLAALDEDLTLKDATPYNVQFRGASPVFVDVGSFEPLRDGEPWLGYRQFCELFLYPLLLAVWKGVPFQPWLRGSLDGIRPSEMRALMSLRDRFRRGALAHVLLHARLERSYARRGRTGGDVKKELRSAGFSKEIVRANVGKMRRLVDGLRWEPPAGVWTDYRAENTYTDADTAAKDAFVATVAEQLGGGLVWDLGCNDGRYAEISAPHADLVVAIDGDPASVELLYRRLRDARRTDILPLTLDLVDAPPGLGWRGRERRRLEDRGRPDLVLCLALLHHVCIAGNVPVAEYVAWLAELRAPVVVELVRREDPMVRRLLAAKPEGTHPDYDEAFFERVLGEAFEVARREVLPSGTRVLYHALPR
jgi:SAM-dependent methyltransferase